MSTVKQAYQSYFDEFGLVNPWPDQLSNNGLRYLAEYAACLVVSDEMDEHRKVELQATLSLCEKSPGLYDRKPGCTIQTSVDDYMGIMYIAHVIGDRGIAKRFIEHGKSTGGFWDNTPSGSRHARSFLYRFLPLMACAKWAAGITPRPWETLAAAVSVILCTLTKHQDPWVLSWFTIRIGADKSVLMNVASRWFSRAMRKHRPGGVGGVLKSYYGSPREKYGAHPAALFLWDEYGE